MSDNSTQNVPAIQKAVKALEQFKNKSMAFARREDFENVSQLYQPSVSIVTIMPDEFTDMGHDNMYPGKAPTNRIGDASGVSFLEDVGGTEEIGNATAVKFVRTANGYIQLEGKFEIVGRAQGWRLKPDGTRRTSSPSEYGYDVVGRTNAEILKNAQYEKPGTKNYWADNEIACRQRFNEIGKAGRQRARTGAELGVIRELVGMPTNFKKGSLNQNGPTEMLFSQVIENNTFKVQVLAEVMKTPDGRAAVVQALFGATRSIFGPGKDSSLFIDASPARQIEAQPGSAPERMLTEEEIQNGEVTEPAPVEKGQGALFQDDIPWDEDPKDVARRGLRNFLALNDPNLLKTKGWETARQVIKEMIDNKDATLEAMKNLIKKSEEWLTKCGYALPTAQGKEGAA